MPYAATLNAGIRIFYTNIINHFPKHTISMLAFPKKIFMSENGAVEAAELLTKLLGVNITKTTLANEIEEHPDFPNFLSISDVLNSYGIDNLVAIFDGDKLGNLPLPFITSIKDKKRHQIFLLLLKKYPMDMFRFSTLQKMIGFPGPIRHFCRFFSARRCI